MATRWTASAPSGHEFIDASRRRIPTAPPIGARRLRSLDDGIGREDLDPRRIALAMRRHAVTYVYPRVVAEDCRSYRQAAGSYPTRIRMTAPVWPRSRHYPPGSQAGLYRMVASDDAKSRRPIGSKRREHDATTSREGKVRRWLNVIPGRSGFHPIPSLGSAAPGRTNTLQTCGIDRGVTFRSRGTQAVRPGETCQA